MKECIKRYYLLLWASLALVTSCNWSDDGFISPDLFVASENFDFVIPFEANKDSVNFENEEVLFAGKFNEKVTWNITISGLKSGAIRQFYGQSDELGESAKWQGKTNGSIKETKLFLEEECVVELRIMGIETLYLDTVRIVKTLKYGFLFSDFENGSGSLVAPWFSPSTQDKEDIILAKVDESGNASQGKGSLLLEGTDVSNNYYIGNIGYNNIGPIKTGTTIPDSLFFNVYVRGSGGASKAKIEFQFTEFDKENWHYQIPTTHVGWKYFSIPYSAFIKTEISEFGNEAQDPHGITLMTMLLSSVPSGSKVDVAIDYPVLTVNTPIFK